MANIPVSIPSFRMAYKSFISCLSMFFLSTSILQLLCKKVSFMDWLPPINSAIKLNRSLIYNFNRLSAGKAVLTACSSFWFMSSNFWSTI